MPGNKEIVIHEKYPDFAEQLIRDADVIFCLDFNEPKRIEKLAPAENFLVVTNARYKDLVLEQIPELGPEQVLCEPVGRNTAPCICYAAYGLQKRDPGAKMIVTPADHLILNEDDFRTIIGECLEFADRHDALLTVGIKPTRPDTGYGYIQVSDDHAISKVKCFTEKPDLELAQTFLQTGEFYWNSGIFIWKVQAIVEAFRKYLPEHHAMFSGMRRALGTDSEKAIVEMVFSECRAISIDYGIMEKADLEKIAQVVRETGILVISDEIYGELTYGDRTHISFASLPDMWQYTITLNGFSKAFAMTGWRVGYACGPKEILSVMLKIHQYSILCAPRMGQVAALEALQAGRANDYEDVRRMRDSYDRRRRLMVDSFRKMGLDCFEPLGAFYVFPSIKKTGLDSETFCERLLNEYKIATVPGTAFGECGEGHIRCSYATGVEKLNIALERMSEFVDKCGK